MQPISLSTVQVKKMNVELVKNTLKTLGVGTKASIAGMTKLSVATCGTILNELLQTGEVIETEFDEPNGGRPAKQYKFNANHSLVLCLIVKTEGGIHSITYVLANLIGAVIEEKTQTLDHIDDEVINHLIGNLIEKYGNVQAIGIGIPGVVHNGIIGVCDVDGLAGKPLGPLLEEKYEMEITIENDMNLTVYGFYHLQNFEEEKTFAVVAFPKNHFPGAGFIVDGKILTGNTRFGGEVSFLPFGMTREEQLKQLHNPEGFVQLAVNTLSSIIAIINPVSIAITGDLSRPSLLEDLYKGCLKDIPEEHMPKLFIKNNTLQEYIKGIITVTLESLTYRLQLIEKR